MEIFSDIDRKAIKPHKCSFCGHEIKKGEIYNLQENKNENGFYKWKSHVKCKEIASYYDMYNECIDGLDSYTFKEFVRELCDQECSLEEKINILYKNSLTNQTKE